MLEVSEVGSHLLVLLVLLLLRPADVKTRQQDSGMESCRTSQAHWAETALSASRAMSRRSSSSQRRLRSSVPCHT